MCAIEELLERKSSVSGLENRERGRRDPSRWPRCTLYLQKLTPTSPTNGSRSVGIGRSRTPTTGVFFFVLFLYFIFSSSNRFCSSPASVYCEKCKSINTKPIKLLSNSFHDIFIKQIQPQCIYFLVFPEDIAHQYKNISPLWYRKSTVCASKTLYQIRRACYMAHKPQKRVIAFLARHFPNVCKNVCHVDCLTALLLHSEHCRIPPQARCFPVQRWSSVLSFSQCRRILTEIHLLYGNAGSFMEQSPW
jgi:hypothetical protein